MNKFIFDFQLNFYRRIMAGGSKASKNQESGTSSKKKSDQKQKKGSSKEGSSKKSTPPNSSMGVQVDTISPGDGQTYPKTGQTVVVHYTGTLTNGQKFDSSRDRGVPFKFRIGKGEVIKGWDEGVAQLSVGQRAKLTCSPDYAYGSRGHPGIIPPNSTLIFDVELLKVE